MYGLPCEDRINMNRIVQMSQLGYFGRFGNQIFQYIFARAYAEKYNAILEIPVWVGQKIFKNVEHPRISTQLPMTKLDTIPWGSVNVDLFGYYQKKECFDIISETKVRNWLQFQDRWIDYFKKREEVNVVAHIRKGDYVSSYANIFCEITRKSYLDACEKFKISKDHITWLSEENQIYDSRLDVDIQFLSDFFLMINADVLLRANSTFSFWTGFFNKNKVYSPVVSGKVGLQDVTFVEGNTTSILTNNPEFCFNL